jgi:hypothetical protein
LPGQRVASLVAGGIDRARAEQLDRAARSLWARQVRTVGAGLVAAGALVALAARQLAPGALWPPGAGTLTAMFLAILGVATVIAGDRFAVTVRRPSDAPVPTMDPHKLASHRFEAELQAPPPRPISSPPLAYALVALILLMAGVLTIVGWRIESRHLRFLDALRRDGVETTGRVISRHTRSGKSTAYYVDYEYRVGRVSYRGSWNSRRDYERMTIGTEVPVTYLPGRPDASRAMRKADLTDANLSRDRNQWFGIIAIAFLPALLLPIGARKFRRLAANGLAAPGVILGTTPRGKLVELTYALEDGLPRTVAIPKRLASPLVPGDTISVLVDPGDRSKSLPYLSIIRYVRIRRGF